MGLYNFQQQFVPHILNGSKQHTIRAKRKNVERVGNTMHLYTGLRQKGARLLGRYPCVKVECIEIDDLPEIFLDKAGPVVRIDGQLLEHDECEQLARRDGFKSLAEMMDFWRGRLPFEGHILHWSIPQHRDRVFDQATIHPQTLATVEEFIRLKFEPQWVWSLKPGGKMHYGSAGDGKGKKPTGQIKEILAAIGQLPLRNVTTDLIQQSIQRRIEQGVSVQTAVHLRNAISAVFHHARSIGFFHRENPAAGVRMPEMVRRPQKALNADQARAVLRVLPRRFPPVFEIAFTSISTSMNIAELLGLKWKYINLTDQFQILDGEALPPRTLFVRMNNYRGRMSTLKTRNRRRSVPLSGAMVEMFKGLREAEVANGPDDFVFQNADGGPAGEDNLRRRVLAPIGKKLELPFSLSWHVFRHTHATLAEQLGIPLSDRQANMGHASGKMTLHYTAADIDRRRAGFEQIAELLTEDHKRKC